MLYDQNILVLTLFCGERFNKKMLSWMPVLNNILNCFRNVYETSRKSKKILLKG